MEIIEIKNNKSKYIDYLFIADPDINMINKYLYSGKLYALKDNDTFLSYCLVDKYDLNNLEIKNLVTPEIYQRKGYARKLVQKVIDIYKNNSHYTSIFIGTGNSSLDNIKFYKSLGFQYSHTITNFFIDNYEEEIFEGSLQAIDMIYLKYDLSNK